MSQKQNTKKNLAKTSQHSKIKHNTKRKKNKSTLRNIGAAFAVMVTVASGIAFVGRDNSNQETKQSFANEVRNAQAGGVADLETGQWVKTRGLNFPYAGEIYQEDGNFYFCNGKNIKQLNIENLTWENKYQAADSKCGDLLFKDGQLKYDWGDKGGAKKMKIDQFDADNNSWETIMDLEKDINVNIPTDFEFVKGHRSYYAEYNPREDKFYIPLRSKETKVHHAFSFDPNTKTWTQESPAIPVFEGITEKGKPTKFWVSNPKFVRNSEGQLFAFNQFYRTVSGRDSMRNNPVEVPENIIMRLDGDTWTNIARPDQGIRLQGFTGEYQWGGATPLMDEKGEVLYAYINNKIYSWNNEENYWITEDEAGYAGGYVYDEVDNGNAIGYSARETKTARVLGANFSHVFSSQILGENCEVAHIRNIAVDTENKIAIGDIATPHTEECLPGYPSLDQVNMRDWRKQNQASFDKELAKKRSSDKSRNNRLDRGFYLIKMDETRTANRSIDPITASYLLSESGSSESLSAAAIDQNGNIILAGKFDNPELPANLSQYNLNSDRVASANTPDSNFNFVVAEEEETPARTASSDATTTTAGKIFVLNPDGTEIVSMSSLGNEIKDIDTDQAGNIYLTGDFGLAKLNPTASEVIWQESLQNSSGKIKMDVTPNGSVATLAGKQAQIWDANGENYQTISLNDSYVEDVAFDETKNRLYLGGFNNERNRNPVQIAYVYAYDVNSGERVWKTWNYEPSTLNNDMADTRVYHLALNADGSSLYASGESAGGNTIFRWNGKDLKTRTGKTSGQGSFSDMWMAKRSAHLNYIAQIDTADGTVKAGTINAAYLASAGRLNTTRAKDGDLSVDANGKVYASGNSAAHIPKRDSTYFAGKRVNGGNNAGYAGSDPFFMILNPELTKREFWVVPSEWKARGKMTQVISQGNKVLIAGNLDGGKAITTDNALQSEPGENVDQKNETTDAYFIVLDQDTAITTTEITTTEDAAEPTDENLQITDAPWEALNKEEVEQIEEDLSDVAEPEEIAEIEQEDAAVEAKEVENDRVLEQNQNNDENTPTDAPAVLDFEPDAPLEPTEAESKCEEGQFLQKIYQGRDLSGDVLNETCVNEINFDLGRNSAFDGGPRDDFSIRWEGRKVFESAEYEINSTTDDGMRILIDDEKIFESWRGQAPTDYDIPVTLNGKHDIVVEYYERGGGAVAKTKFNRVITPEMLASGDFSCGSGQFMETYYEGKGVTDESELLLARCSDKIDYNWKRRSPSGAVPRDNFTGVFETQLELEAGNYEFTSTTDDGVRVYVNDELIIDRWRDQAPRTYKGNIQLEEGIHNIKMEYYERGGGAVARLRWNKR